MRSIHEETNQSGRETPSHVTGAVLIMADWVVTTVQKWAHRGFDQRGPHPGEARLHN